MDNYEEFKKRIKHAATSFKDLKSDKDLTSENIRIISHLDSDGISSAAILIKALENENFQHEISIIQQLSLEFIDEIAKEPHKIIFFTDLGSGNIDAVHEKLKGSGKKIFILDHHEIGCSTGANSGDICKTEYESIIHVNPHLFNIDGGKEISGAGVVFLFAKELNEKNNSMAHIAVIGAIGDVQENNGFMKLNKEILDIAIEQGLMKVKKGLKCFGRTRALHKMLEYSSEPFIPGVSGSESGAIQLLHEAGIHPMNASGLDKSEKSAKTGSGNTYINNDDFKRLMDLSESEEKRLASAIILRRLGEKNPEDIFGFNYHLPNENFDSLKDAKEFSTLLNASGRMKNASLGIGVCLGDEKIKKKAIMNLLDYKKEIVTAIKWFNENKAKNELNKDIIIDKNNKFMIINAKDNILSTIAGTLASIISKSNEYEKGMMLLSMARSPDGVKTSLRIVGDTDIDLREVLKKIVAKTGGETGGHKNAAGAIIPMSKEVEFIRFAQIILSENSYFTTKN